MGIFKDEDIRGYRVEGEIICMGCVRLDEVEKCDQSEVILNIELEDAEEPYYCARCKRLIEKR